ncbi:hypothetical protein SAMN04490180_0650 [Pseudomonas brassicacearum]|nr:hypothetical protein SAMN04490180_0650 [Pseudomonas brassicacearum]
MVWSKLFGLYVLRFSDVSHRLPTMRTAAASAKGCCYHNYLSYILFRCSSTHSEQQHGGAGLEGGFDDSAFKVEREVGAATGSTSWGNCIQDSIH